MADYCNLGESAIAHIFGDSLTAFCTLAVIKTQYMVIPLNSTDAQNSCARIRAVQDYATWILSDPQAAQIANGLQWAIMPVKISQEAVAIVSSMTCTTRSPEPPWLRPAIRWRGWRCAACLRGQHAHGRSRTHPTMQHPCLPACADAPPPTSH